MKHDLKVTYFLMLLFFSAQVVGLFFLSQTIESIETTETGEIEVVYTEPITGRPELEGQDSFTYTIVMILLGTGLLLLLIKFRLFKVWKAWFFLAVWGALSIAFSAFVPDVFALIIAAIITYLKLYRPNVYIHNLSEIFMYAGITILMAPIFEVFWMILLLIAISVYDAIAVWKSKHMIVMAKAQAQERMFAGLLIPYSKTSEETKIITKKISAAKIKSEIPKGFIEKEVKSAILGGGDIAFPLLFAGSVMTSLIQSGLSKEVAFFQSLIISFFAGVSLFMLLIKSSKDKFYPAMPFITIGCLIGYGIVLII